MWQQVCPGNTKSAQMYRSLHIDKETAGKTQFLLSRFFLTTEVFVKKISLNSLYSIEMKEHKKCSKHECNDRFLSAPYIHISLIWGVFVNIIASLRHILKINLPDVLQMQYQSQGAYCYCSSWRMQSEIWFHIIHSSVIYVVSKAPICRFLSYYHNRNIIHPHRISAFTSTSKCFLLS